MKKSYTVAVALFAGLAVSASGKLAASEPVTGSAEPLELRRIMQDMGREVAAIAEAASREEWQQVRESALRIADHPRPPKSERRKIMALFGEDMSRFKSYDTETHDTARELAEVAAKKDGPAVISIFATLLNSCLACHQSFRKPLQEHFYGKQGAE